MYDDMDSIITIGEFYEKAAGGHCIPVFFTLMPRRPAYRHAPAIQVPRKGAGLTSGRVAQS